MKKIILSLMAVSALFACQKESFTEPSADAAVTFTANVDGADTKTVLDADALKTKWSGEEWIQVVGSQAYWFGSENITTPSLSASFSYNGGNGEYVETGAVMAVYPAGSDPYAADLASKTVSGVVIPNKQYPKAGTFDPNAALAVAYTENSTLNFKNAVALLKFTIGADNITAACIYAKDGGDISGTYSASLASGVPVLTPGKKIEDGKEVSAASQWVDFYPGEGTAFVKGSAYYVAIAPVTFPNGFVITLGGKEVAKYESSATFNRNVIYDMGTIGTDADSGDPIVPWAVAGAFNGWSSDANPMTLQGDHYVLKNVTKLDFFDGEDEDTDNDHGFKFVENGKDWRGGKGEVDAKAWDWVYEQDGVNIYVKDAAESDAFDIYLNPETRKYVVVPAGTAMPEDKPVDAETLEWAIVGSMTNWTDNIAMTLEGDWHVATNVSIRTSDEFKFRVGTGWDTQRTYTASTVAAGTEYTTIDGQGTGNSIKVAASAVYDVYLYKDASKFKIVKKSELSAKDYSQCQVELVGAGISAQTGAEDDTSIWNWGNVMLASNNGKPSLSGTTYTWTWNNVNIAASGWKVRTVNHDVSGGISAFACGYDNIDTTNSVALSPTDNDRNIILAAGTYNITFKIDAVNDTKTIVIKSAN